MASANCDNHVLAFQYYFHSFIKLFNLLVTCFLISRVNIIMAPPQMVPITKGLLCELSEN